MTPTAPATSGPPRRPSTPRPARPSPAPSPTPPPPPPTSRLPSPAAPANATSVTLIDAWPGGFTRGTTTSSQGTCTTTTGQNFSCSLGTLAQGGSATVSVNYTVPASTLAGPQTNTVIVSSDTPDSVPGNNTATDTNTVATSPPPEPEPQDPIITTVSCNPSTVQVNQPTTCTATRSEEH